MRFSLAGHLASAAMLMLVAGPAAHAVTIGFSGFDELEVYDEEGSGELIGSLFLQVSGSFDFDPSGAENPTNPGEYVAVASNPWLSIAVESFFTLGGNSAEQDQIVLDLADSFPLESNFPFVLDLPGSSFDGARNDIGEAFASSIQLSFNFPSNPGNNSLALLENLYLELNGAFGPGTLAGATQSLLAAANPNDILSSAFLYYDGQLSPEYFLSIEFSEVTVTVVPVPAAWLLMLSGLGVLGMQPRSSHAGYSGAMHR